MKNLVLIRLKYLNRNLLYFYIIIAFLFLLGLCILVINSINFHDEIYKKKPPVIISSFNLFNRTIDTINNKYFKVIFADEEECKYIQKFIKIECINETKYKSYDYAFSISNIDNKFIIKLYSKESGLIWHSGGPFFESLSLDENLNIEIFNYNNSNYTETDIKDLNLFLDIQSFFAEYLIFRKTGQKPNYEVNITMGLNAFPQYRYLSFLHSELSKKLFASSFVFILLNSILAVCKYIFHLIIREEFKNNLSDFLENNNFPKHKYILSLFYSYISILIIPSLIIILIFLYFTYHIFIFILDIILYLITGFSFSLLLLYIVKKKNYPIIIIYSIMNFIGFMAYNNNFFKPFNYILCLFPDINFIFSLNVYFKLNSFINISLDSLKLDLNKVSFIDNLIMYLIDMIFYLLIGLIISNINKSKLECIFIKIKKYEERKKKIDNNLLIINDNASKINFQKQNIDNVNNEGTILTINNLSKIYDSIKIIDNLNLQLFSNEIFCLYNNNKLFTNMLFNIITGLNEPTEGYILLNRNVINKSQDFINRNIGTYLNKDILLDYLTVEEYIKFLYNIKKLSVNENDINNILNKIHLNNYNDVICNQLDKYQKKMLTLSSTLIGNPKVILLEDPHTIFETNEDLFELNNFLKELKKDKIILITTNSIAWAQNIGNKIGIVSNNHIIFSQTVNYFTTICANYKNIYDINIYINTQIFSEEKYNILIQHLKDFEPNLFVNFKNNELFSFKINSSKEHIINDILTFIESSKNEFGIEDYTITNSSVESFIEKIKLTDNSEIYNNIININENNNINIYKGFISQLFLLLYFKCKFLFRNFFIYKMSIFIILGICICICLIYPKLESSDTFIPMKLLEGNPIYIYEEKENYLKNSDTYNLSRNIKLINIKDIPNDITDFMNKIYEQSLLNIAKSGIAIKKLNDTKYEIYNTEIYNNDFGYLYANLMIIVSAFLKNEYNIDASIATLYEYKNYILFDTDMNPIYKFIFELYLIAFLISKYIFLFGKILNEKDKEKENSNKFVLNLYGGNKLSNYISSLLIDYIKVIYISLLFLIPIYYFFNSAIYIIYTIPFLSLSTIIFLYLISNFFSKAKFKNVFIATIYTSIIPILIIVIQYIFQKTITSFLILSVFPLFSYIYIYIYIILNSFLEDRLPNELNNIRNYNIIQIINIFLYGFLLYLYESGFLKKYKKDSCCKRDNYIYPKETIDYEFFDNNELNAFYKEKDKIYNDNSIKENFSDNLLNNTNNNIINSYSPFIGNDMLNENLINNEEENNYNENIVIKELYKTYYGTNDVRAIENLSLILTKNEKLCLLGPNNCGKTTLIKAILNEINYQNGKISLPQNIKIGYCPQNNPFFEYMTVKEIIMYFIYLKASTETIDSICRKYDLYDCLDTYSICLSPINQKKLLLSITLMDNPNLIILDEPSTKNSEIKKIVKKLINNLIKNGHNFSMILSSQSIEEGEMICDRVSWMKEGKLYLCDDSPQIKIQNNSIFKLYVKFDYSKLNNQVLMKNEMNQQLFYNLLALIEKVDKYKEYLFQRLYLNYQLLKLLINFTNNIKTYLYKIKLIKIGNDLSFTLVIGIIKEKKKEFYNNIINYEINYPEISEISII